MNPPPGDHDSHHAKRTPTAATRAQRRWCPVKDRWNKVIEDTTQRMGSGEDQYCCVTVTDCFGGRGHDFNVMDPKANERVACSLPQLQYRTRGSGSMEGANGATGQARSVCNRAVWEDPPFTGRSLRLSIASSPTTTTSFAAQQEGRAIRGTLEKYSGEQVKGALAQQQCGVLQTAQPHHGRRLAQLTVHGKGRELRNALKKTTRR